MLSPKWMKIKEIQAEGPLPPHIIYCHPLSLKSYQDQRVTNVTKKQDGNNRFFLLLKFMTESIQKACGSEYVREAHSEHSSQAKQQFSTENSHAYKHTLWGWGTNSICSSYLVCFGWKQERRAQLPLNTGPGSKSNTISLGTECRRGLGVRDWYFRRQRISWFKGAVRREREGQANTGRQTHRRNERSHGE